MDTKADFERRWSDVSKAIRDASARAGRSPDSVRVIGVTKTVDNSALEPLLAVGVRDFGENRWQHAKLLLDDPLASKATWHFIGHLQTNKAKYIVPRFAYVHSVDSTLLLDELERQAQRFDTDIRGFIQVNVSGEESKFGLEPHEAASVLEEGMRCKRVHLVGLMTMAPQGASEATTRSVFRGLADLQKELQQQFSLEEFKELSMGMSDDFEWAIEEGATMVRIGRRLMGTSTPA